MPAPSYPRDLVGYGRTPPHAQWPGNARIAVQFVINYEEGGENCILHGDAGSEAFLSEIVGATSWPGQRHMNMESIYEYGARVGYWRLWRMFTGRRMPVTVFGVASAMARHPNIVASMAEAGWEIATHGLKWIEYQGFSRADEAAEIHQAVRIHTEITGQRPLGFYQGRCSANTLELVMAEQGFLYSADSYADELPYWVHGPVGPQLIVPYTLDANDMRFATPQGFNSGDQFYAYLKDTFDTLYAEGKTAPKMMSIGLHCRLVGRPGRAAALARFLDYVQAHESVWVATRLDIARHWIKTHPPTGGYQPALMPRALLTERLAEVFEHSPWVAERVAAFGPHADVAALHAAMMRCVLHASADEQLALIRAHPELAGREAAANSLTHDSSSEQARLGFTALSRAELDVMARINQRYRDTFGFPCIVALTRHTTRATVIAEMQSRLTSSRAAELATALEQIGHIGRGRLNKIFGVTG